LTHSIFQVRDKDAHSMLCVQLTVVSHVGEWKDKPQLLPLSGYPALLPHIPARQTYSNNSADIHGKNA